MGRDPLVVFVFGSNLAGRHGRGAAKTAREKWKAEYGIGKGRTRNAYAIPTKDENLKPLSLQDISKEYQIFLDYVDSNPDIDFLLTPFGTGLAGHSLDNIKSLINDWPIPQNVWLTGDWF